MFGATTHPLNTPLESQELSQLQNHIERALCVILMLGASEDARANRESRVLLSSAGWQRETAARAPSQGPLLLHHLEEEQSVEFRSNEDGGTDYVDHGAVAEPNFSTRFEGERVPTVREAEGVVGRVHDVDVLSRKSPATDGSVLRSVFLRLQPSERFSKGRAVLDGAGHLDHDVYVVRILRFRCGRIGDAQVCRSSTQKDDFEREFRQNWRDASQKVVVVHGVALRSSRNLPDAMWAPPISRTVGFCCHPSRSESQFVLDRAHVADSRVEVLRLSDVRVRAALLLLGHRTLLAQYRAT